MRYGVWGIGLCGILVSVAFPCAGVELTQAHEPLELNVGFTGWSFDTGWMGSTVLSGNIGAYIRLWAGVGGTVLDFSASGAGKLEHPTAPDTGSLWFEGETGSASQDVGVEFHGQYKITLFSAEYTGNLPYVPSTDLRLSDSESFTPYLPETNIVLEDHIDNQQLFLYPIGVANIFSANIGVSVTVGDRIEIDPKTLDSDKGVAETDGQHFNVAAAGATLTVSDIYEMIGIDPTMTILPNAIVGVTVGPFTYNITIPTYTIDVPLKSLLDSEYATTPSRSITFNIPPVLRSFTINNGASTTMGRVVNLDNTSSNVPLEYMASESSTFEGATWLPYATQAQFTLQAVDGTRTVYFRTRNANGVSDTMSDTIQLDRTLPSVNRLITSDATPALSGSVAYPTAAVSVYVGGQTRNATNNGAGQWSLADDALSPLAQGVYDVTVTVTDAIGNTLSDSGTDELTIDTSAPTVTVNSLRTGDQTPQLHGTVADNMDLVSVYVTVAGGTYLAAFGEGVWTVDVTSTLPEDTYDVQVAAVDAAGNVGHDATTDELVIDLSAVDISVNTLVTSNASPRLTGTIGETDATISVRVIGVGVLPSATNNSDGTWYADTAPIALSEGVYEVIATATAPGGRTGTDGSTKELTIDRTAPTVRVTRLTTNDTTPRLSGDFSDATATTVSISVAGQAPVATVGDNTWTADVVTALAAGTYNVQATATDKAGNVGHDSTVDELIIDTTAPAVTVDALTTNNRFPGLSGTVNDTSATVRVTVGTQTLQALNTGTGRWTLAAGLLVRQAEGAHEVEVTATDPAGNVGQDTTHYELVIDTIVPKVTIATVSSSPTGMDAIAFRVTFSEPVSPVLTQATATGSLASTATVNVSGTGPVYDVTVFLQEPDTNGTIGISIPSAVYRDSANNVCVGGTSGLCVVQNWCGFGIEPEAQRLYIGDSCTFSALANCGVGGDLTYQWKWDNGTKITQDGPALSSWSLASVTPDMQGDYWCVVRYDTDDHATVHASLDVRDHLVIAVQPSGATLDPGGAYEFAVDAQGGYAPLRYQWKRNGIDVSGATTPALSLSPLVVEHAGVYTVDVSDSNLDSQTSSQAVLHVKAPLPGPAAPQVLVLAMVACVLIGLWVLSGGRGKAPRTRN